ncbi:hypothetical protein BGW80DRAFT_1254263 [Lactifluus volemus]|nr:hypothetical protein BGW80DRAFT_1254263 [Lactifluus volemus]
MSADWEIDLEAQPSTSTAAVPGCLLASASITWEFTKGVTETPRVRALGRVRADVKYSLHRASGGFGDSFETGMQHGLGGTPIKYVVRVSSPDRMSSYTETDKYEEVTTFIRHCHEKQVDRLQSLHRHFVNGKSVFERRTENNIQPEQSN